MAIDLNQLRVFVAVAELGAMTKAAKALKMPVSRVSRTVARLEEALGATLITRTTRSLRVSEAGKRLHQASRPLMQQITEIEHEFHASEAVIAGLVRVTAPEDMGGAIIAPVLAELSAVHSALQIELICSDQRFDLVQDGIDVGIRIGKLQDSSLKSRRLGVTSMTCVAAPGYLKRAGTPRTPHDLDKHDCIQLALGASDSPNLWTLSNGKQQISIRIAPKLRANHTGAAIAFALAERGILCVPAPMVVDSLQSGQLVRVLPNWSFSSRLVNLIFPNQRTIAPRVKTVISHLEKRLPPYFQAILP